MKKHVLKYLFVLMAVMGGTLVPMAQNRTDREQWLNEMNQYKRNYFTKELDLSVQQQAKFFPLYEEMNEQTRKIDSDARVMEQRVAEAQDATDLEYEKATEAVYDAKVRTAEIEKEYMQKFREILSSKQVFLLNNVERKFSREMMRQHHRLRSTKKAEMK